MNLTLRLHSQGLLLLTGLWIFAALTVFGSALLASLEDAVAIRQLVVLASIRRLAPAMAWLEIALRPPSRMFNLI